jgi:hypothetical protein
MPTFWVGIIMLMIFAVYWNIFPLWGMGMPGVQYPTFWAELLSKLRHLFLPVITFTLILIGEYALIMLNSLLEVMHEDYMLTARAKGVSNTDLLRRHALPNAMLPMVTLIAINLGFIIGGAIQIETVFSWPGLGRLMYSALTDRDYPVLQGLFLFITICVILANLGADIILLVGEGRVSSSAVSADVNAPSPSGRGQGEGMGVRACARYRMSRLPPAEAQGQVGTRSCFIPPTVKPFHTAMRRTLALRMGGSLEIPAHISEEINYKILEPRVRKIG